MSSSTNVSTLTDAQRRLMDCEISDITSSGQHSANVTKYATARRYVDGDIAEEFPVFLKWGDAAGELINEVLAYRCNLALGSPVNVPACVIRELDVRGFGVTRAVMVAEFIDGKTLREYREETGYSLPSDAHDALHLFDAAIGNCQDRHAMNVMIDANETVWAIDNMMTDDLTDATPSELASTGGTDIKPYRSCRVCEWSENPGVNAWDTPDTDDDQLNEWCTECEISVGSLVEHNAEEHNTANRDPYDVLNETCGKARTVCNMGNTCLTCRADIGKLIA